MWLVPSAHEKSLCSKFKLAFSFGARSNHSVMLLQDINPLPSTSFS
jgi:hypothetical protein